MAAAQAAFVAIRASGPVSAVVNARLKKAAGNIAVSTILIDTALDASLPGPDRAGRLRAWLAPKSALVLLASALKDLGSLVPGTAVQLNSIAVSLETDLADLRENLKTIQTGPAHADAVARGEKDMLRPREIIDTLRHETNRYALGIVGIADIGRVWPDPYGTRYAFGGGGRFSLVNLNFTLGYAVNPKPQRELGLARQGRFAFFHHLYQLISVTPAGIAMQYVA